jgi:hypothetical protein
MRLLLERNYVFRCRYFGNRGPSHDRRCGRAARSILSNLVEFNPLGAQNESEIGTADYVGEWLFFLLLVTW